MVRRTRKAGLLRFTVDIESGVCDTDIVMIAVGTPAGENGRCDLRALEAVAASLAALPPGEYFAVIKSTVPAGTADWLEDYLNQAAEGSSWEVVSNPEFLRQGSAIRDAVEADRIIIGAASEKAARILQELYKPLNRTVLVTDRRSAEMIKYASNSFLAAKISFINEIAGICEKTGADVTKVAEGMALDRRIGGAFLGAGIGFGGSCLPKDLAGLIHTAKQHDLRVPLLESVKEINDRQVKILPERLAHIYGEVSGKTVCVWGLAYKPGTDDLRDAPSIRIIDDLIKRNCVVKTFDPMLAARNKIAAMFAKIETYADPYEAAKDAAAILLVTEWGLLREVDWVKLRDIVNVPLILDGRNIFAPHEVEKAGFTYIGIGRGCSAY